MYCTYYMYVCRVGDAVAAAGAAAGGDAAAAGAAAAAFWSEAGRCAYSLSLSLCKFYAKLCVSGETAGE
jgi:hypothetical protein